MAVEITPITSEALQAAIRTLLPSQRGFGDDLQATNLIQPVIDLTATAEGSGLPVDLARALSFQSQTAFSVTNQTTTVINNTGFFRIFGIMNMLPSASAVRDCRIELFDGSTAKIILNFDQLSNGTSNYTVVPFDFIAFLASGETLRMVSGSAQTLLAGSTRQVATVGGTLVNPIGFTGE